MDVTLLGQAGVHIALKNGRSIVIDPYLSNVLFDEKDLLFKRLVPASSYWQNNRPNIIAITHDHADHMDLPSLEKWLDGQEKLQVLAPYPVFRELSRRWPRRHNIMIMSPEVEATVHGVRFRAIPAFHETPDAVGYLINAEGVTIYLTGDTLYSCRIINSLNGYKIDLMLPCINGFGNNMNYMDAARMANAVKPKLVIPVHWDMFADFGEDPELFVNLIEPGIDAMVLQAYNTISI